MFGDAIAFLIGGIAAGWLLWTYLPHSLMYRLRRLPPPEHEQTAHTACGGCSLGGVCGSRANTAGWGHKAPLQPPVDKPIEQ